MMHTHRMTPAAFDRLHARLAEYKEKRAKLRAEVARARSEGDLSENAGYHAAREALAIVEFQIQRLETKLNEAELVEANGALETVEPGHIITLRDLDSQKEQTYRLAEMEEGGELPIMTPHSPLGKAVLGKKVEEIIEMNGPRGTKRFVLVGIAEE